MIIKSNSSNLEFIDYLKIVNTYEDLEKIGYYKILIPDLNKEIEILENTDYNIKYSIKNLKNNSNYINIYVGKGSNNYPFYNFYKSTNIDKKYNEFIEIKSENLYLESKLNELGNTIDQRIIYSDIDKQNYVIPDDDDDDEITGNYRNTVKIILKSIRENIYYSDKSDESKKEYYFMTTPESNLKYKDNSGVTKNVLIEIRNLIKEYKTEFIKYRNGLNNEKKKEIELINIISKYEIKLTNLDVNMKYRFIGYNLSDSFPFYISDKGKNKNRPDKIKINGDGQYNNGISGYESFTLEFINNDIDYNLYYYTTSNQNIFQFNLIKEFGNINKKYYIKKEIENLNLNDKLKNGFYRKKSNELIKYNVISDNINFTVTNLLNQNPPPLIRLGYYNIEVIYILDNESEYGYLYNKNLYIPFSVSNNLIKSSKNFNDDISKWDVSNVTSMNSTFKNLKVLM